MVDVVGVKFRDAGKLYYFDLASCQVAAGDHVIVETAKGSEYGTVVLAEKQVEEKEVVSPLKKVLRKADEKDEEKHRENLEKRGSALAKCQEKIDKHGLQMKLVDVEYAFDNSKIIFYFTADGRVDFRALVKDLASVFRTRIELRQIGVRDEAKMMGGIGNCGRGLCCHEWMRDFQPVSIKMAKTQNLSLNPTKISGICGRLMCCLKYENDIYEELRKGMPQTGERVKIEEGMAIVTECNILEQKIKCRLIEEEKDDEGHGYKLSTEVYSCTKDMFQRAEKPRRSRRNRRRKKPGRHEEVKKH